jgi:hypothetical protein
MTEEVKPEEFHINIKKLRLRAFRINESVDAPSPEELKINMQQMIQYSLADLTITLDLTISFQTADDVLIMEGTGHNIFTIQELPIMIIPENPDQINIPDNILATLLSISISHTRALMSQSALGSKFQDIMVPLVNPSNLISSRSEKS